jgi:hypothetical protein
LHNVRIATVIPANLRSWAFTASYAAPASADALSRRS